MIFILGLPRSRTYWFSQWLPNAIHEGIWYFKDYNDIRKVYNIDCTTCHVEIERYIKKEDKVIIIDRDYNEVMNSLVKLFGNISYSLMKKRFDHLKQMKGLRIEFNDINNRLEDIWNMCTDLSFQCDIRDQKLNNDFLINEVRQCL